MYLYIYTSIYIYKVVLILSKYIYSIRKGTFHIDTHLIEMYFFIFT